MPKKIFVGIFCYKQTAMHNQLHTGLTLWQGVLAVEILGFYANLGLIWPKLFSHQKMICITQGFRKNKIYYNMHCNKSTMRL